MSISAPGRRIPRLVSSLIASAALAAAAIALTGPAATAATTASAAIGGTTILASGPSGFPDRIAVVGASSAGIVLANTDQSGLGTDYYVESYDRVPVGNGRPVPIGGSDGVVPGSSVAGSTFVYLTDVGQAHWTDLVSGRSGIGRDVSTGTSWQTAAPGGGAWVDTSTTPERLLMTTTAAPNATPIVLASLPGFTDGVAVTASANGIVAVSGAEVEYFSFAAHAVHALNTGGVSAKNFTCTSATATVIGCFDSTEVESIPTDGSAPSVFDVAGVDQVAVTPTATAWIVRATGVLGGVSGGFGERRFFETGFAVSGVVAVGSNFVYSRIGTRVGGVYRLSAAGDDTLLARAPALPRRTFTIALTAGRVSWIDDSTVDHPVRSRRLEAAGSFVGPTVVTATASSGPPPGGGYPIDDSTSGLSISGTRALFVLGRHPSGGHVGAVVLVGSRGRQNLAASGNGDVGLSGERALWGSASGHLMLRELATGRTVDLTPSVGPDLVNSSGDLGTALFGRYLAYAHGGFAWRVDLASGRRVRAGRSNSNAGIGNVMTAGDWVISRYGGGASAQLKYRNVRTLGPVRSVGGNRTLESVSPAGFVSLTRSGKQLFRAWGSTTDSALPAAEGSIRADGGELAWIGLDGRPRLAPFPASAARPRALGAPLASARVRVGQPWQLDQPTSEPLTSCTLVIRAASAAVVARIRCASRGDQQGEALGTWQPTRAGRYTWQVVAANRSGPVLSATGTPGTPVRGTVLVTR